MIDLIVAASFKQADITATIEYGWARSMVRGQRGWRRNPWDEGVIYAGHPEQLRGLPIGTGVYFASDWIVSEAGGEAALLVAGGRLQERKHTVA